MVSVIVRLLDGSNARYDDVVPGTTVLQFKQRIQERQDIPTGEQKLLYAGQFLEDHKELDEYNIREVGQTSLFPTAFFDSPWFKAGGFS